MTVQAGNTCDIISATYSVSTYVPSLHYLVHLFIQVMSSYQLAAVNSGIIDAACDNLYVGEVTT